LLTLQLGNAKQIPWQIITVCQFCFRGHDQAMSERRTKPRFEICLDVRWQASAAHYNVRIADISEDGCYVDTILDVTKGERLFLKILMIDGGWIEVEGVVAHHSPRLGFGVRFVNLSEEDRHRISALTEQFDPIDETSDAPAWDVEKINISCHQVM
jgi:PilZ domain-containing protein